MATMSGMSGFVDRVLVTIPLHAEKKLNQAPVFELVYHPTIFPTVNGSIAHAQVVTQFVTGPTLF